MHTTDHAAKAANDTQEAPTAPAFSKEQIEGQAYEIAEVLITADDMEMSADQIAQALAARYPGTNGPDAGLVTQALALLEKSGNTVARGVEGGPVYPLTIKGIRWVMEVRKELADLALKRKEDELRAFRRRVDHEHMLVRDVQSCEADVEAAKAEVTAAKERLAESNKKLAAYVAGGVQTSIIEDKPKGDGHRTAYEQGLGAWAPGKACANPYPADPQRADWQRGWDEKQAAADADTAPEWVKRKLPGHVTNDDPAKLVMPEALRRLIQNGAEGVSVAPHAMDAFERPYLVTEEHEGAFLALPLYTKDEWGDLHESNFGRPVDGVDQTTDAAAKRTTGGDLCGRVVKVGRKKFIIGPVGDGLAVTMEDPDGDGDGADGEGEKGDDADA
jgi:hypothetical protein